MTVREFGNTAKGKATLYTLCNQNGCEVSVTDFGATWVSFVIPDKTGEKKDVLLGYDSAESYEREDGQLGATVGRVANRIGGASFELNGKTYQLTANSAGNTLHGGRDFYGQRLWKTTVENDHCITFSLHSQHMDQNFPGNADISVTYELTEANELKIHYRAVSDEDTLMNLTNHGYFNLSGHDSGDVLDQEVVIFSDGYTKADENAIPIGEIIPVEDTPMDFRKFKKIGKEIDEKYEALILGHGYDHNWVINGTGMRKAAMMRSLQTGILMEVFTDLPGVQFYTGNYIGEVIGKNGVTYRDRYGACFETQYFPDAVHKENFEGPILKAGQVYDTTTIYKFTV